MMRVGMSEQDIYKRTQDVFHHFHCPTIIRRRMGDVFILLSSGA